MTANGEVQTREEATVYVKRLDLFVKVMFLEGTLRSFFLGETLWGSLVYVPLDQRSKTTSHQKWQENWLQYNELCTICGSWFISEFFLNCTFTYFSIIFITGFRIWCQQIHRKPSTRSTSEELRGDPLHEPTETENNNKNGEREEVQRDMSHELHDWLQEFRENLVDESTSTEPWPEQGSQDTSKSPHKLPMEPRAKVEPGSGMHSVYTHFPKELWYLHEDENNKGFLQKTCWYSRAQSGTFWWLDYSGSQISQWRKWIAVVSYPCKIKSSQEDPEERCEVPGADEETKSHLR